MATENRLHAQLRRLPFKVQRAFNRLSPEQKGTVARHFHRHVQNCDRLECNVDPQWLPEASMDVRKGWLEKETLT